MWDLRGTFMFRSGHTGDAGSEHPRLGLWCRLLVVSGISLSAAIGAIMVAGLGPQGREFGLSDAQSGLVIGIGSLIGIAAGPLWGRQCDRLGHQWFLIRGLGLLALVAAGFAVMIRAAPALSLTWIVSGLIALRVIQSSVGAALLPSTQRFVGEHFTPEARVSGMGMLNASVTAGALAGLLVLAHAGGQDLAWGLWGLSGIAAAAAIWAFAATVPSRPIRVDDTPGPRVPTWQILPGLTVTFLVHLIYVQMQSAVGVQMMDRFELSSHTATTFTGVILVGSAVSVFVCQLTITLFRRWNARLLMCFASACAVVGTIGFASASSVPQLAASVLLLGAALGAMLPPNFANLSLAGSGTELGRTFGLNTAARGAGVALGPFMGISLYAIDPVAHFASLIAFAAGLCVVVFASKRVSAGS